MKSGLIANNTPAQSLVQVDEKNDKNSNVGSSKLFSLMSSAKNTMQKPFLLVKDFFNNQLFGTKQERTNAFYKVNLTESIKAGNSEPVSLQGNAGTLSGYFHKAGSDSKKVVLFLHGSGSSGDEQAEHIRSHYQQKDVSVLAVNMRGYGSSEGVPSENGFYDDARTMFDHLVKDRHINPADIVIHGYSMGAPVAANLASVVAKNGQSVSGILLDRPMPSMSKAVSAQGVTNLGGLTGKISKAINGNFSVAKNIEGMSRDTPVMLLTDSEGLGKEGEKMRDLLKSKGFSVTGKKTAFEHEDSEKVMTSQIDNIVSDLFN